MAYIYIYIYILQGLGVEGLGCLAVRRQKINVGWCPNTSRWNELLSACPCQIGKELRQLETVVLLDLKFLSQTITPISAQRP